MSIIQTLKAIYPNEIIVHRRQPIVRTAYGMALNKTGMVQHMLRHTEAPLKVMSTAHINRQPPNPFQAQVMWMGNKDNGTLLSSRFIPGSMPCQYQESLSPLPGKPFGLCYQSRLQMGESPTMCHRVEHDMTEHGDLSRFLQHVNQLRMHVVNLFLRKA
jgi:hypothetical protein